MKKKYNIIKTEVFKEQEKKLPKEVKKDLDKVLDTLSSQGPNIQNSMNLFSQPSPEELKNWMGKTKIETIDLVLEYLYDKDCLKESGVKLAHEFWKKYIQEKSE